MANENIKIMNWKNGLLLSTVSYMLYLILWFILDDETAGQLPETAGQLPVSGVFAAQAVQVLRHGLGVRLQRIQQAVRHIRAVLADGGNDLMGDPALEGSRFRLAGAKDQMIESGFTYLPIHYFYILVGHIRYKVTSYSAKIGIYIFS